MQQILLTVICNWKEGYVLFNDALNTFYLRIYGVGHMVKKTQDSIYHNLCYTSCGALARTRNSLMGSPWRIDPTTHCTMSKCSYHGATFMQLGIWLRTTKITRKETSCHNFMAFFSEQQQRYYMCTIPQTMAFVTQVVKHWLEQVGRDGINVKLELVLMSEVLNCTEPCNKHNIMN